jgi:hypothetical protein
MKQINCATSSNTASYFIDQDGDILESLHDATSPVVAEVIVDGFYVGSADEMRKAALRKYLAATEA